MGERRVRALVVDDYADAAELLADVLRAKGYDARTAHDGRRAYEMAVEFDPDVAFIDIGLPVLDGYEVARRFRSLPRGTTLLLIALTGRAGSVDRERSTQPGFNMHLVKPIDLEKIESVLASLVPR